MDRLHKINNWLSHSTPIVPVPIVPKLTWWSTVCLPDWTVIRLISCSLNPALALSSELCRAEVQLQTDSPFMSDIWHLNFIQTNGRIWIVSTYLRCSFAFWISFVLDWLKKQTNKKNTQALLRKCSNYISLYCRLMYNTKLYVHLMTNGCNNMCVIVLFNMSTCGVSYHVTKFCHQASTWRVHVQHLTVSPAEVKATKPTTTSDQSLSKTKNVPIVFKNLRWYIYKKRSV